MLVNVAMDRLSKSRKIIKWVRTYCSIPRVLPAVLTHLDEKGRARMVDVSDKPATKRTARATATVNLGVSTYDTVAASVQGEAAWKKGDIFTVAEIAGIQAAKSTFNVIPLCHPVPLSHVSVNLQLQPPACVTIDSVAVTTAPTGVEMEALTAASVAALTVYDMCKAAGKGIVISDVRLVEKTGGRSGGYRIPPTDDISPVLGVDDPESNKNGTQP